MFASRDQENLVHGHQTAAAAKPLNQGITGLAPKTPGPKAPKTPFKIPLNDENGGLRGGKAILQARGKGAENVLVTGKKPGDVDKQAFITPVAPRNRAPLGMKTTNAKARPLQTPAVTGIDDPLLKTQKRSGSARRQKLKVQQADSVKLDAENESHDFQEREIEYMPPRAIDLPDDPDDIIPPNQTYPMFEGANLTRGWWQHSAKFVEEDDEEEQERKEAEEKARYDKMADNLVNKSIEQETYIGWDIPEYPGAETAMGLQQKRKNKAKVGNGTALLATKKPLVSEGPSTLKSRSAAAALSQCSKGSAQPRIAAPTIAAKAKAPSSIVCSKKPITLPAQSESSNMRHASATAASRTTLGFSKGRAASSSLRSLPSSSRSSSLLTNNNRNLSSSNHFRSSVKDQPDDHLPFPKSKIDPSSPSFEMELWMQARALGITNGEEDEHESLPAWMKAPAGGRDEEDEFAEFQLVVPNF